MKYDFHQKKFIDTTIHKNKIAIAGSDVDISWETLQIKVEQLSDEFKKLGIPTGHPVMIYGHKEALFPAAILACIHAGITYIPVDKIYPVDRIKKIVEKTGAQIVINCADTPLAIFFAVTIDAGIQTTVTEKPDYVNKIYGSIHDPLQYIMFTSGSTGEPKGVQITSSSILTFVDWALKDFGFKSDDVFMNQAPFTFDVSLCDVLNAFAFGGTLVLTSTAVIKNQETFLSRIAAYGCSVWTSTPSFAFLFLRHPDFKSEKLSALHTFLFMGEELPNRTCGILITHFNNARILNAYGPTEATIVTTLVEITKDIIDQYPSLPIGYPMPDSELLIEKTNTADKEGELIIVGNHVSIGYFKNETSDSNKFFIHHGSRAFRTGDLAYYEKGMLFYSGRNDDQVKMHGFRIELNEINHVISKHAAIADAVTLPLKRNKEVKKIVSFIILKDTADPTEIKLQLLSFLEKSLPYYMVPGDIVVVPAFPYGTSHKIDKNKLIQDYITN